MSGSLVYVMGPSGSGKDSLLRQAREVLATRPADLARLCFAHRYITRAVSLDAENHIALSPAEFEARRRAGLFSLHWRSHGLDYGIGAEVERWLAQGMTVVINGSREHLRTARKRFPQLRAVLIDVSLETQRQRLLARGREDAMAVEERLSRTAALSWVADEQTVLIRNEGSLSQGTEQLLRVLRGMYRSADGSDHSSLLPAPEAAHEV